MTMGNEQATASSSGASSTKNEDTPLQEDETMEEVKKETPQVADDDETRRIENVEEKTEAIADETHGTKEAEATMDEEEPKKEVENETSKPAAKADETMEVEEPMKEEGQPVEKEVTTQVKEEDEEETQKPVTDDHDDEDMFYRPAKRPKKNPRRRLPQQIPIRIKTKTIGSSSMSVARPPPSPPPVSIQMPHQFCHDDDDEYTNAEQEMEDSLAFFAETHEEQDPSYQTLLRQRALAATEHQLDQIHQVDKQKRAEIEVVVRTKYEEKQRITEGEFEKHAHRIQNEQALNLRRIDQLYQQRLDEIQRQMNNGMDLLQRQHRDRLAAANARHEDHHRVAPLEAKHRREVDDFAAKVEEMKKKTEKDYQKNQDKVRKHFHDRLQEEEQTKKRARQKLIQNFRMLQSRYLKQHAQKMAKEKDDILLASASAEPSPDKKKSSSGEGNNVQQQQQSGPPETKSSSQTDLSTSIVLKPTEPIQSIPSWVTTEQLEKSGGVARYRHRKGITSSLTRQLSIEIHNEGIWMSTVVNSSSASSDEKEKNRNNNNQEYIPWGTTKATEVLDAIVCGEIPVRCEGLLELHPQAAELSATQGGLVRCVLFDLRTSELTASQRRAMALKEQEERAMKELEHSIMEYKNRANEADHEAKRLGMRHKDETNAIQIAEENNKKAKMMHNDFLCKYQQMIGTDGKPIPGLEPSKAKELSQRLDAMQKDVDACQQKATLAKRAHEESRTKVQKLVSLAKEAQKKSAIATNMLKRRQAIALASSGAKRRVSDLVESEKAATRIEDTIGALKRVAEHRRHQVEQMKKPNASRQWIQSFPTIPGALKKSLWHKLHRRKHHVVLRPSSEAMINELRVAVTQKVALKFPAMTTAEKNATAEKEMLRSESLFLLAMHPVADEPVSPFPPQKVLSDWGEPGWKLDLSVPSRDEYEGSDGLNLVYRRKTLPVFEQRLAEMMSTPGRQAAAFLKPHTTRCLSSPLSAFSIASSPAEEATALPTSRVVADDDAFNMTEEAMGLGYTFSLPTPRHSPIQSKKRSAASSNKNNNDSMMQDSKHNRIAASASPPAQTAKQEIKKPSSPRRTSSAKKQQSAPSPRSQKSRVDTTNTMPLPQNPQQQGMPSQQSQQQVQQHQQQNALHGHLHRNQQLMQQQPNAMSHQQHQQSAMHPLQRYPQAQQYPNAQMAQIRMMQAATAGSPRHQLNPNFPPQALQQMQQFYNPMGHSYPMAMQASLRQQPTNPAAVHARRQQQQSNQHQLQQQQQHALRQQQQHQQQAAAAAAQQQLNAQQQQANQQANQPPSQNQQQQPTQHPI